MTERRIEPYLISILRAMFTVSKVAHHANMGIEPPLIQLDVGLDMKVFVCVCVSQPVCMCKRHMVLFRSWRPASPAAVCAWARVPPGGGDRRRGRPPGRSGGAGGGSSADAPHGGAPPANGRPRSPAGPRGGHPGASVPPPRPLCAWSLERGERGEWTGRRGRNVEIEG